ncbi:MAG TPA: hypothetical protein PK324_21125, partial [Nocardioides sp.]|nr:hypothetical protein [Nocardioides sp.]
GAPVVEKAKITELLATVEEANSDLLPADSCGARDGTVACLNPAPNIRAAILTTYPTPQELYDAYARAVTRLSDGSEPRNVGDCTRKQANGEVSWNLDRRHRADISVAEHVHGGLDPESEAAGRLFCTETNDVVSLVWTLDPGLLVTATGQPTALTMAWWNRVHLDLASQAEPRG